MRADRSSAPISFGASVNSCQYGKVQQQQNSENPRQIALWNEWTHLAPKNPWYEKIQNINTISAALWSKSPRANCAWIHFAPGGPDCTDIGSIWDPLERLKVQQPEMEQWYHWYSGTPKLPSSDPALFQHAPGRATTNRQKQTQKST